MKIKDQSAENLKRIFKRNKLDYDFISGGRSMQNSGYGRSSFSPQRTQRNHKGAQKEYARTDCKSKRALLR